MEFAANFSLFHSRISHRLIIREPIKSPASIEAGLGDKALAMTYSCMRMHTTIGAAAFHFRVRDGIGWFHSAIFTRERVEGRGSLATGFSRMIGHRSRSRSHGDGT